ncbi:MAG TPA: amidohydrolase [Actinomycetota bacterium]
MARHADVLIRGGRVVGADGTAGGATALACRDGRILAVGRDDELEDLLGPDTDVVDAGGGSVLPGFVDAHSHVRLGSNPDAVDLAGATTLEEIRSRIDAHVAARPGLGWIEGTGWNYAAVPGGRPTAALLDGVGGGRPVFLLSYDAHTAWLDREAIRRLGIRAGTVALPWGHAALDPATGEPTGFVTDFAVLGISEAGERALADAGVPGYRPDAAYARLLASLDMAVGYGITTVVEPQNGLDDLALFARARDDGRLGPRLIAAMLCLPDTDGARLDALEEARRTFDDDRLRAGPIKLYADDVVEPHTAAMLEPYADRPDMSGDTFWDPEDLARFLVELERRGFQSFTHATGDRGVRTVLDAVQACRAAHGPRDARHQIVHAECVHPDDVRRFATLGVVACMQPRHCAPDIVADWRRAVGPERERRAWPFRSLVSAGATLALSSDWNVAEMDPMTWLYTAITRADPHGEGAWNTDETIDLATALRAATFGGAYANFVERERGTLEPGTAADVVVLSRDVHAIDDPLELLSTTARATVVAGEVLARRYR